MLQSRFAALSHVVATSEFWFSFSYDFSIGNCLVHVTLITDHLVSGPKRHSTHHPATATTPVRRLGEVPETCLDHHTPPYGDEDAVRKRQRGLQEMTEFALGDKSLPSVRGEG